MNTDNTTDQQLAFLLQSKAFLSAMFECSSQGLLITDVDMTVVRYNVVAEHFFDRFFGIQLSELVSLKKLSESNHGDVLAAQLEKAAGEKNIHFVNDYISDGKQFWFSIHIIPIYDLQGSQLGLSITLEDITPIKQAELAATNKLVEFEQYNSQLSTIVKELTHEGFKKSRKKKEVVVFNQDNAQEPVNFAAMIEEIRNALDITPGGKTKLLLRINEESVFKGDKSKIHNILENLMQIAMHNRDVTKPESFISLQINVNESRAKVVIADNGCGTLQEQNVKVKNKETSVPQLRSTHQTLSELNGSINIESTPAVGTAFEIIIPNLFHHASTHVQQGSGSRR